MAILLVTTMLQLLFSFSDCSGLRYVVGSRHPEDRSKERFQREIFHRGCSVISLPLR